MVYLEYETKTKQVVQIHESTPADSIGYDFATSDEFVVGDEFEMTIWVNEIDEHKKLTSYSAIRNNPNAKRLLQENAELKNAQSETDSMLLEFMESVLIGGM